MDDSRQMYKLLPEAFFDLIGRVAPGTVVLFLLLLGNPDLFLRTESATQQMGAISTGFSALIFAYLIGLLLDILGNIAEVLFIKLWNLTRAKDNKIKNNTELIKFVKDNNPDYYQVFLKMSAESVALRSMFLASAAIVFSNSAPALSQPRLIVASVVFLLLAYWHISSETRKRAQHIPDTDSE